MLTLLTFSVGAYTGSGTQDSPYLISTADDFIEMARKVNAGELSGQSGLYFRLENDITLPADFTGVGKASGNPMNGEQAVKVPFEGIFDGNGHTITVSMSGRSYVGLFVANQGTIRNLTVAGEVNGAGVNCGALVAFNCGGTVENCVNKAAVTVAGNKYHVGGIAGFSYGGKIDGCKNEGSVTVTAGHTAGGIVGYVGYDAKVTNCENTGAITGGYEIGGITGYLGTKSAEGTQISGCVNRGTINATRTTDSRSGGIAAVAVSGNLIESCTNYGKVEGPSAAGGIVGRLFSMTVKNCLNEGSVTANIQYAGGIVGWNEKSDSAAVNGCVNKANVTGAKNAAAVIGAAPNNMTAQNNYYTAGAADSHGTHVAPDKVGDPKQFPGLDKTVWIFTVNGPELRTFHKHDGSHRAVSISDKQHQWTCSCFEYTGGAVENHTFNAEKVCSLCGFVKSHVHSFDSGAWASDESGHWHPCTAEGCTVTDFSSLPESGFAAHTSADDDGDCTTPILCSVCDFILTPGNAAHAYPDADAEGAYSISDTKHWQKCVNCTATTAPEDHTYTPGTNVCSVCGFVKSHVHSFDMDAWDKNESGHWHPCTAEGCTITDFSSIPESGFAAHTSADDDGDCTTPILCSACDFVLTPGNAAHTYPDAGEAGAYITSDTKHWQKCVNCAVTTTPEAHTFGEWIVTKPAKPGVAGEESRTCSECGLVEKRPIEALPEEEGNRNLIALVVGNNKGEYTVRFSTVGAAKIESQTVKKGKTAAEPEEPVKAGFYFAGWYRDARYQTPYNFAAPVTEDLTLFAKWDTADPRIVMTVGSIDVSVFGMATYADVPPVIVNNRTMLPARFAAEALGGVVTWNAEARKVTIISGETGIELYIDSTAAYIDGREVTLDSAPFIKDDRTYLPVRFIAEALGAKVDWVPESGKIVLTKTAQ